MRTKARRSRNPYRFDVLSAARAARDAYRIGKGITRTVQRFRGRPRAIGVTTQHDVVSQYKKSYMPKKKKKAWRKFTKKVTAAVDKHLGTRSIVRNYTYFGALGVGQQQGYCDFGLYTLGDSWTAAAGTVFDLYRDVANIGVAVGIGDPNAVAGTSDNSSRKMEFRSAVLDFTFKNQSSTNGLEIDVYMIVPKKGARNSANNDVTTIMNNGWNNTGTPAGGTNLTTGTRGVTPWQSTALCRRFTILNKKKYFIPAGNTFTYQYRDPKNYTVDTNRFANGGLSYYGLPHMNKMILMCIKRIVGESTVAAHDFAIGITRTYTMKRFSDADEDLSI